MNYKLWNIKCTLLQILACERLKSTSFRYMLLLVNINWFDTLKAINSGTDVIFTVEIMLSKLTIVYCYHRSKKWRQKLQQNLRVLDSHKMKRIFTFHPLLLEGYDSLLVNSSHSKLQWLSPSKHESFYRYDNKNWNNKFYRYFMYCTVL